MKTPEKYAVTTLPTKEDAAKMAVEYDQWAATARDNDKPGSARQFELMALLLRFYADH